MIRGNTLQKEGLSMMQDLLQLISNEMKGFSKGQKRIGAFILEHYDKAAFMTAAKLGETVGVSESTVVRFADWALRAIPSCKNPCRISSATG